MEHLNIASSSELNERLDKEVLREKIKRSALIKKTGRKVKTALLREGYKSMAQEGKKIMDDFRFLDRESLKYVDEVCWTPPSKSVLI